MDLPGFDKQILDLNNQIETLRQQRIALEIRRRGVFIEKYPVVYVVEKKCKGLGNYVDSTAPLAYFIRREDAITHMKGFNGYNTSHHIILYNVKAEATENLADEWLQLVDTCLAKSY